MIKVRPVPGEPERFYVTSATRPEVEHIVDVNWVECPGDQARPFCGCEESMAKGNVCRHIKAVADYLKTKL